MVGLVDGARAGASRVHGVEPGAGAAEAVGVRLSHKVGAALDAWYLRTTSACAEK